MKTTKTTKTKQGYTRVTTESGRGWSKTTVEKKGTNPFGYYNTEKIIRREK